MPLFLFIYFLKIPLFGGLSAKCTQFFKIPLFGGYQQNVPNFLGGNFSCDVCACVCFFYILINKMPSVDGVLNS